MADISVKGIPTQVAGSASAVVLLPPNSGRRGASIVNDSSAVLYILCAENVTVSSSIYTIALAAKVTVGSYYEIPYGYRGTITGIWASAAGNAIITEFV